MLGVAEEVGRKKLLLKDPRLKSLSPFGGDARVCTLSAPRRDSSAAQAENDFQIPQPGIFRE